MEDRLKNLRKSMNRTAFYDLNFTEQHQKKIRTNVRKSVERDEDIILAILQLLINRKTGHELSMLLNARGISKFEEEEGLLYTLLHQLENNYCIQSEWDNSNIKTYFLNKKGMKILRDYEKNNVAKRISFKELFEG